MQNWTQEDGGTIFGADGRQYDFEYNRCGQGPAIHIVGGFGGGSGLGLHIFKNKFWYCKEYRYNFFISTYVYNASFFIPLKAK